MRLAQQRPLRAPAEGYKARPAIDRQAIVRNWNASTASSWCSNDDTLSAEDMALGYKQQQRVEEAWRTMKSGEDAPGVSLGAASHPCPHRHHRPVLLLERTIEHACPGYVAQYPRRSGSAFSFALLSSPNGQVWQVTEPSPDAANQR